MSSEKNIVARRLVQSYLSSVISISLVLLLVGLLLSFAVNADTVSDYFKENVRVTAVLEQDASDESARAVMREIVSRRYVSNVEFISREQGTREMEEMLGEDFFSIFDVNPVPVSVEIFLDADYFNTDSLAVIKKEIEGLQNVEELVYKESLVSVINSNMEKIGAVFGVLLVMLMFISFVLIAGTVRLNIYSKRFTVHAMKLVGATKSFIRAPFLYKAVFQGMVSGLLAVVYLLGLMYYLRSEFVQMFSMVDFHRMAAVLSAVVLLGILICTVSTWIVVNRMVDMSKDKMYF